jgi:phage/plasmid primase-like uncharacterized protein
MDFITFCRLNGILISSLPPLGIWRRYPTEDHPRSRNGAVKWMGEVGFVQNHATMIEVSVWKTEGPSQVNHRELQEATKNAELAQLARQRDAAQKAAWILKQCQFASHEYLKKKGFPDEVGNVWVKDGERLLIIPMRIEDRLVGCQLISEDGVKKFLTGQKTSEAAFSFDNKGANILCEGYATALSIRAVLKALRRRYRIHVCFSAGNMGKVAAKLSGGYIVADNDASGTGERAAREIGWPYYLPPVVGNDFNDHHLAVGMFKAGQDLIKSLKTL